MNERPKNIWNRPWRGRSKVLGWFVMLTAAAFAIIMGLGLASAEDNKPSDLVLSALVLSLGISVLATAMILFVRWLCCWQNFRRFLFGLVCLVTLIALFYAVENWRGKRAWENYRYEWEAKGQKFDRRDFIPPFVPDDQNFAMTPYFARLYDFKPGTQEHPTNWFEQFENLKQKIGALDLKASEQTHSNSWVRSQSDLSAWYAAFLRDRDKKTDDLTLTDATPQELATKALTALSAANDVLDEIRTASRRPHARFNIHYENDDPAAILLPHLSILKHLSRVLQLRASAELTLGRADDAIADINLMFHLTEAARNEPILISQLVRFAQFQLILQPIAQGLETHQWSDSQLLALQQRFQAFDFCADSKHAFDAERALFGGGILEYIRRLSSRERLRYMDAIGIWSETSDKTHYSWSTLCASIMPTGWYYLEQLNYDQAYQTHLLPVVDVENHRISPKLAQKAYGKLDEVTSLRLHAAFLSHRLFSKMLLPALPGIAEKAARAQTAADVATIACARERFYIANGTYPPTLGALTPQFVTKLPHDVINGQPLKYRRTETNSFILYSVGWNEKDDGGTVVLSKDGKTVDWKEGDWVWRYPLP